LKFPSERVHCQHLWLTPAILATQEAEVRRITVRSQPGQIVQETLSRKTLSQKIGLVEWLKVKALSSSLSTTERERERERETERDRERERVNIAITIKYNVCFLVRS
jgi:hypothetical protein